MGRGTLSWKSKRERLRVRSGQTLQRIRVLWDMRNLQLTCVIFQNSALLTEAFPSNAYRHLLKKKKKAKAAIVGVRRTESLALP